MPGGVNSPVRSFQNVGGTPLIAKEGKGAYLIDVDGNKYIDYVCSFGPLILGHSHPRIISALNSTIQKGTSFGLTTQGEVELCKLIKQAFPFIDKLRLVNSGTEAVLSALRLARAYTNRELIIKFQGCYHGHIDSLLVEAGSGGLTFSKPTSSGIPKAILNNTIVLEYNNIEQVYETVSKLHKEISALILEPVAGNMGVVLPESKFLYELRELTSKYSILLIFDEVITGFRLEYGGASTKFNIVPDLICLGKIIGGGLPIGAYGGREEIMQLLSPLGPVYQAGTLAGNPLCTTAGIETLKELKEKNPYLELEEKGKWLQEEVSKLPGIVMNRIGSMFSLFFTTHSRVTNFQEVSMCNREKYKKFFWSLLEKRIYFPPSPFESCFISTAHSLKDLEETVKAIKETVKNL